MGILLTVAVTHPENVPTIDLQYEVIDHYFASDRMSGKPGGLSGSVKCICVVTGCRNFKCDKHAVINIYETYSPFLPLIPLKDVGLAVD